MRSRQRTLPVSVPELSPPSYNDTDSSNSVPGESVNFWRSIDPPDAIEKNTIQSLVLFRAPFGSVVWRTAHELFLEVVVVVGLHEESVVIFRGSLKGDLVVHF